MEILVSLSERYGLRVARFACVLALACDARGQESSSVPVLSGGDVEVSAFGGFNVGQSFTRVSTTAFRAGLTPTNVVTPSSNGSIGGAGHVSVTPRFLLDVEVSYIGGGHLIFNQDYVLNQVPLVEQRVSIDAHSSAVLATGGGRYLLPISRRSHIVPFVGGGGGALRIRDHLKQAVIGGAPGQTFSGSAVITRSIGFASIGAEYYFTERTGIAVEGSAFRGPDFSVFGRLSVGLFLKLR